MKAISRAIQGLAVLGVAAVAGAFTLGFGGVALEAAFNTGTGLAALGSLALTGVSMEAGAIASALTSNRGSNITVRQPAAYRQVVYGTRRVGGTMVRFSSTGAKHDQVNYIIMLAGHVCDSILGFYLDGRQVHFEVGSVGNSTRNGVNFGGHADGGTYTGPGGVQYNFGGLVYVEACYGDQTNQPNTTPGGGFNTGYQANDPTFAPSAEGLPYYGGCTYVYFKYVYDAVQFPSPPEVRVTLRGKCDILDPRTGLRGYTSNWALVCADVLTDKQYGLGDDSVNEAQLIAAANVCDEQVALAAGGTENRYACHYVGDSSAGPGAMLNQMMPAAAGRFSRSGGEWYLWPAYWQGPSFRFNDDHLAGDYVWNPTRERRDLINRVTGTYCAASYPYNATTANGSNLYDPNGFYDGTIQDNFGFAFQTTSIPYYAKDALHGYPSNQYLLEDGGDLLQRDIALPCVLSIAQAQRILKITLERNRQQGSAMLMMFPVAFRMMQMDVMQFSMARMGWVDKVFEITSVGLGMAPGANGVPTPQVKVGVQETAASVYEWETSEELDIYLAEVAPSVSYMPYPPENMRLTSSAVTAIKGPDGIVQPRIEVQWDDPPDGLVTQIQTQYQAVGDAVWMDGGSVDVSLNFAYLSPVVAGRTYNVRIRSLRAGGAASAWVTINGFTAGLVLSSVTSAGMNPNSPYNVDNTAVLDSISEGGAATIRIYGPGGDGSSFTRFLGAVGSPMSAAHITGEAYSTGYYVVFDTVGQSYLAFTNYNDSLADQYIFIGSVGTLSSTYTGTGSGGGSSGGGGSYAGGGRNVLLLEVQSGDS